ncbi:MAG: hypothetical protein M1823_007670, partial [Watsoniomyces obsoletus]
NAREIPSVADQRVAGESRLAGDSVLASRFAEEVTNRLRLAATRQALGDVSDWLGQEGYEEISLRYSFIAVLPPLF